MKRGVDS